MKMKIRVSLLTGLLRLNRGEGPGRKGIVWIKMRFLRIVRSIRRNQMEQEIFTGCILVRNMAVVQEEKPMAADYYLEELAKSSHALSPVYSDMLFLWRSGRMAEAFDVLPREVGSRASRDFAFILSGIDKINPSELAAAMRSFEEAFAGERMTCSMRKADRKSVASALAATASVFAVLINFTVVVVFMDMFQALSSLGI